MRRYFSAFDQHRLLGGAIVLAITQFGASIAGLISQRMLNVTFPAAQKEVVDVYLSSFRLSDMLFQMTIMAGFSVALVPLLARYKADDKKQDMSALLNGVMGIAALLFGTLALVIAIFFPLIAPFLVQFKGESLELYIMFGRLALLSNLLFVFGNAFGQYLVTIQKYWIYGLTPILYTAGTIVGTVFLTRYFGAYGPMLGTILGAIVYVIVRFAGVFVNGYRFAWKVWHPDIAELGWLMLPRMLALGAIQLELLLFDRLASGLDVGSITINANARNFQSVIVGVAGIALAQSAFSLLSQAAAKKDMKRFWLYLRKGIGMLLLMTVPGAILLYFVSPIAAHLVGLEEFLAIFATCIGVYAISIPFESINHLLLRSYYALKETTAPAIFSVLNGIGAIIVTWFLVPHFGVYALAAGFTAGHILQMIGLAVFLPRYTKKVK